MNLYPDFRRTLSKASHRSIYAYPLLCRKHWFIISARLKVASSDFSLKDFRKKQTHFFCKEMLLLFQYMKTLNLFIHTRYRMQIVCILQHVARDNVRSRQQLICIFSTNLLIVDKFFFLFSISNDFSRTAGNLLFNV